MSSKPKNKAPETATKITFDLAQVLTPQELEKFTAAAKAAGASSLKEHFMNISLGTEILGMLNLQQKNVRI